MKLALIGIFGVLGIYSRYFIDLTFQSQENSFPTATLIANSLGCLIIGILSGLIAQKTQSIYVKPLMIGFCGGLTTFSSYSLQILNLFTLEQTLKATLYFIISPILGLSFVILGYFLTNQTLLTQN
jgi:fluoride exporter